MGWGKGPGPTTRALSWDGRVRLVVGDDADPTAPPSPKSHVLRKTLRGRNPKKASIFTCYNSVTFSVARKKPVTFLGATCFNPRPKNVDGGGFCTNCQDCGSHGPEPEPVSLV